jgi:hypothetical protein
MKSMKRIFLILSLLLPVTVLISSASLAETKIEATIFSYDGKDFVRTETTLMEGGQSTANTKLDRDSAAYKALVEKRSYTGPATLFGRAYQANYAPLTGEDGKSTLRVHASRVDDFRVGAGRAPALRLRGGLTFQPYRRSSAPGLFVRS